MRGEILYKQTCNILFIILITNEKANPFTLATKGAIYYVIIVLALF